MDDDTITLTATDHGCREFTVNRADYEQAKQDGTLDHLLDAQLCRIEHETTIREPDGTEFDPYGDY